MFPGSVETLGNWRRAIRWCLRNIRTPAGALLVALGIGARDGCFQMSATRGEYLKLRLHALLCDLQLSATGFTQFLGMRATHTCQTMLDVFRLEIFFELL